MDGTMDLSVPPLYSDKMYTIAKDSLTDDFILQQLPSIVRPKIWRLQCDDLDDLSANLLNGLI